MPLSFEKAMNSFSDPILEDPSFLISMSYSVVMLNDIGIISLKISVPRTTSTKPMTYIFWNGSHARESEMNQMRTTRTYEIVVQWTAVEYLQMLAVAEFWTAAQIIWKTESTSRVGCSVICFQAKIGFSRYPSLQRSKVQVSYDYSIGRAKAKMRTPQKPSRPMTFDSSISYTEKSFSLMVFTELSKKMATMRKLTPCCDVVVSFPWIPRYPIMNYPVRIIKIDEIWWTCNFLDKKITAIIAVSTTTSPLIISNTEAAHCESAIINEQKAIMSKMVIILMRNTIEFEAGFFVGWDWKLNVLDGDWSFIGSYWSKYTQCSSSSFF